jgi:hypothetical protein
VVNLIPVKHKFKYASLKRQDTSEGRKYVYGDQKLPSVTTIISATKDKSGLEAWAKRIGEDKAEKLIGL